MSKSIGHILGDVPYDDPREYLKDIYNDPNNLYSWQNQLNNDAQQYAQNNYANVSTDAQYTNNPNYISDEDLYNRIGVNIAQYEKLKQHPYLDSKGYITTGYGANINNKEDFMKVNFMINGRPATDAEKEQYYYDLRGKSMMIDANHNFIYHNMNADNFSGYTPLRISQEDALNMAQNHMTNDLAKVRREFSDFDKFPLPLKEVLLDIQYNTGNLNRQNWPNLYQAIENRDINGIVQKVHRKDVGQERNDWAERTARLIRF